MEGLTYAITRTMVSWFHLRFMREWNSSVATETE